MAYKKEFDIDIIGGQEPLTKEEEKMISDFIRLRKEQQNQKYKPKPRRAKTKKECV